MCIRDRVDSVPCSYFLMRIFFFTVANSLSVNRSVISLEGAANNIWWETSLGGYPVSITICDMGTLIVVLRVIESDM